MNRLLLIDGNAIMHRAFHALPALNNQKTGEMTNAVYGFFSMLLNCIKDQKPTHVIVCFDRPKPSFRQALYAGYHEDRPTMADGLSPQFGMVHEALEKLHVPIFEVDGYEGDDMIGTIATQAQQVAIDEVIILTGDRDMMQLVNSCVKVLMPVLGVTKTVLYDEAKVVEKFGVTPEQFIDYKALIGDASDGYPGVTGIGPKTAATLLQKYRTFDNLYASVGELSERIAIQLATDAEQAALAKKLATIVTDAPITLKIDEASVSKFDLLGLKESFEKYGFNSLLQRFEEQFSNAKKPSKKVSDEQMTLL